MQENLKKKYGITDEELKRAVNQINFGRIACNGPTIMALVDLVCSGDIKGEEPDSIKKTAKNKLSINGKCCYCGKVLNIEISSDEGIDADINPIIESSGFCRRLDGKICCLSCMVKIYQK